MGMLDGLDILSWLSDEQKSNLEIFCQSRILLAGEELFGEWEEANAMYFLKEGSLSIDKMIDGEQVHLWEAHAEEVIGEMALFGWNNKRMASATALEDSQLITILSFSVAELTSQHPELLEKIKELIEIRNIQNKTKGVS